VDKAEAGYLMLEVHATTCGPHMNGILLAKKIMLLGYYWTTMETDCCKFVRRCHRCQIHGNLIHAPPKELYSMASPWPFSTWGIDVVGEIHPAASNGHRYIMVAIDYFTKWVEATSYHTVTAAATEKFIRNNIITRYGVPYEIITDNGKNFVAKRLEDYLQQFRIQHHRSSPYRPQMNGAVEAANKNIIKILKKTVESGRDWQEKLPYTLWAYRTSIRISTGATPFSLVYGRESIL
jgi:transposase InsO family protein